MIDKFILKNGDILFVHTNGFSPISWGIRILTESAWNHSGMIVIDDDGKIWVIEAVGRGVVKTPIEDYLNNTKKYRLKVSRFREDAFKDRKEYTDGILTAVRRMREAVGKKYDYKAIAWLGLVYLFKGLYKKGKSCIPIGNPLQSRNKFFCSELVCYSCYKISSLYDYLFQGTTKQKCDTTTPKDISKSKNVFCLAA